jgi:hypothetical protein
MQEKSANRRGTDLAELLPLQWGMKSSLHLVKGSQPPAVKKAQIREKRFRFPAEEVWEVSYGPMRRGVTTADFASTPRTKRKAS